jgi:hypothetical protein
VARQHFGQENRKRPAATSTLAPIRTEHPLAALGLTTRIGRIIAVELAVTIQTLGAAAVRTPLLLERKSSRCNSSSPVRKRKNFDFNMPRVAAKAAHPRPALFHKHQRRDSLTRDQKKKSDGTGRHNSICATLPP